jgi:L-Lysine epsilon oxidase N-terminal/L-lysine epsilon oxidase C-terminal domain
MDLLQFRIHPSVGMARFGESTEWYFLGPEFPRFMQEQFPNLRHKSLALRHPSKPAATTAPAKPADGSFRDAAGEVIPQAARFRIFAYAFNVGSHEPYRVVEVTSTDADIEWTVTLANRKTVRSATGKVEVNDPAPVKMTTNPPSPPSNCQKPGSFPNLAWLKLEDGTGRLHVVGNEGIDLNLQPTPPAPAERLFQLDWFDTAADGSVSAVVKPKASFLSRFAGFKYLVPGTKDAQALPSSGTVDAVSAWVVVNMPDYVPDFGHFVSLWDVVLAQTWKQVADHKVVAVDGRHFLATDSINDYAFYDYETHIHPVLVTFTDVNFTSGQSRNASGRGSAHQLGLVIEEKLSAAAAAAATTLATSMRIGLRLLAAATMNPAGPPRAFAPFNIALSVNEDNPFSAGHEIVSCTKIDDDGTLTVTRGTAGTAAAAWPSGTLFLTTPKGTFVEAKLIDDISLTDTVLSVEEVSTHKMRQPSTAADDLNEGPFFIAITDGTNAEWVKCTKNDKRLGQLSVVRGQLGTSARAWPKTTATLVAAGGGHKKYDARANIEKLARGARGPARERIHDRLRIPEKLYQRKFKPLSGSGLTDFPRQYGRRWNITGPDGIDTVTGDPMIPSGVNIVPEDSLARHWDDFKHKSGSACLGEAMGSPDAKIPQLDDFYWIATERDMPMLKDYALTQIQFDQFEYWAMGTKPTDSKLRWAPLFTVLFKNSPIGAFLRAQRPAAGGHTLEEYFQEFAKRLPRYTPAMLDMANLGKMLGGSFLPGIEVGREGGRAPNWSLTHGATKYFPDLRFHPSTGTTPHTPGMLTKDLAIPWYRDFISCDESYWPTSRPQIVYHDMGFAYQWLHGTFHDTDDYWRNVGFIRRSDDGFVEKERVLDIRT